ncbi:MAG TPA: hypothetical protein VHC94_20925 [Nitrobacter sp.]|jgi:hypothetical protein|nr:hypothetical protein [Nitrobacter sp.]
MAPRIIEVFDRDRDARATEALDNARRMKPGPARNAALKEAGRLRAAVNVQRYAESSELKPPK